MSSQWGLLSVTWERLEETPAVRVEAPWVLGACALTCRYDQRKARASPTAAVAKAKLHLLSMLASVLGEKRQY